MQKAKILETSSQKVYKINPRIDLQRNRNNMHLIRIEVHLVVTPATSSQRASNGHRMSIEQAPLVPNNK